MSVAHFIKGKSTNSGGFDEHPLPKYVIRLLVAMY